MHAYMKSPAYGYAHAALFACACACALVLSSCREDTRHARALPDPTPPAGSKEAPAERPAEAEAVAGTGAPSPGPGMESAGPASLADSLHAIDLRYLGPYPAESDPEMPGMLIPGEHHGDEVPAGAEKQDWLALHADPGGAYRLSPARIRIERFFDRIADKDSSAPTGKRVAAPGISGPVVFLMAAAGPLKESLVDTAVGALTPDRNAKTLRFRGKEYKLEYEYSPVPSQAEKDTSWRLLLTVTGQTPAPARLLLDDGLSSFVSAVVFAGDLDGDGQLDFLLAGGTDSGVRTYTLYLSRPAGPRLLKAVAHFRTVAC
jgi:hypothetical protein